jgi:hypothetical protein
MSSALPFPPHENRQAQAMNRVGQPPTDASDEAPPARRTYPEMLALARDRFGEQVKKIWCQKSDNGNAHIFLH